MVTAAAAITTMLALPAMAIATPSGSSSLVPTSPGPIQTVHGTASAYSKKHPGTVPAGTNNFACKPDKVHSDPIILIHGTDSDAYADYAMFAPKLTAAGNCVFAMNYGGLVKDGRLQYGEADIHESGAQLSDFVQKVLNATKAKSVQIVGYSQGANVTRYYVNKLGGAKVTSTWLGLASPSYGGTLYGVVPLLRSIPGAEKKADEVFSVALQQQAAGATFMKELNSPSDTVAGPQYYTVGSKVDERIQPIENQALLGAGAHNILIGDLCKKNQAGHMQLPYDPFTQQVMLNILSPADAKAPVCETVELGTGIAEVMLASN